MMMPEFADWMGMLERGMLERDAGWIVFVFKHGGQ